MYLPSSAQQTYAFLLCIGFGFLLGIFYHFTQFFIKVILPFKKGIIVGDILYCIVCGFSLYCFLLCINNGEVRLFTLLGLFLGFIIYYFTFGTVVAKFFNTFAKMLFKILSPFKHFVNKIVKKIKKTLKKSKNKPNNT